MALLLRTSCCLLVIPVFLLCQAATECEYGEWSAWGECSASCGTGKNGAKGQQGRGRAGLDDCGIETQIRDCSPPVLCPAPEKSSDEPPKVEAALSLPSEVELEAEQEDGNLTSLGVEGQLRNETVESLATPTPEKTEAEDVGSQLLADLGVLDENGPPCVYGNWSEWSECSEKCRGGQRNRRRDLLRGSEVERIACPPEENQTAACNVKPCLSGNETQAPAQACSYSPWTAWSACPQTCGLLGNYKMRWRHEERRANTSDELRCEDVVSFEPCILPPCSSNASLCTNRKDGVYGDSEEDCSPKYLLCLNRTDLWFYCSPGKVFSPDFTECVPKQDFSLCSEYRPRGSSASSLQLRKDRPSRLYAVVGVLTIIFVSALEELLIIS